MNIFKKVYYRIHQGVFKLMLPLLPYRQPKVLKTNKEVVEVLKEKNFSRVLLVTDKGIKGLGLTQGIENEAAKEAVQLYVFDEVVPNPTTDNVEKCLGIYKENNCQAIIAIGGGSVMDCAKATGARVARPKKSLKQMKGVLKVWKKIPLLIAVPTTAGTGSETTLAAVITDSQTRHKYAINDFPLIPSYALLDPSLTIGLPKHITSTTGMDALTHAVEAYIGKSTTEDTRDAALQAVNGIFKNILEVYNNGQNVEARENMLNASYKAGVAFTKSYVGYVHAIAHTLGGKYNVPHGLANAVILPYVLKRYGTKIYKKLWELGVYADLFDEETSKEEGAKIFIEKIEELNAKMSIPLTLDVIQEEDIPSLAQTAAKEANPLYPVPVILDVADLEKLFYEVKNGL